MPLAPGTRIGTYEITSLLGKGGMGEVYRARDAKLGRDVAVKVLPAAMVANPERLARFQREAKVLAALNHPNIATVYALEEFEGGKALIMELVDGAPIQGPLPVDQAVKVAIQIADALEAAHDKGITHRDIKPGNILITKQGVVKVLDFGLAAVSQNEHESTTPDGATALTLTISPTQAGMILGTAGYMSPEQASGQPVDRHADIWAFGVVLYELLTGQRLFHGDTVAHILADVIRAPIDLAKIPEGPGRDLLARCLERDLRKRLHAIGEARIALERASDAPVRRSTSLPQSKLAWAVAAAFALGLIALALIHFREQPPELKVMQFSIPLPEKARTEVRTLTVSPDGRYLAFVAQGDSAPQIWVRALDSQQLVALAGTENADFPFWSPDSRTIAFFGADKLKKIAVTGGPVQELCDAPVGRGGSWSSAGVIVFAANNGNYGLSRVSAAGGVPVPATKKEGGGSHRWPHFLPDGNHYLYQTNAFDKGQGVHLRSLDAKVEAEDIVLVPDESMPAYYAPSPGNPSGLLLFVRQGTLMAQPLDPKSFQVKGDLFPVAERVASNVNTAGHFLYSLSQTGLLVFETGSPVGNNQHTWYDRSGKEVAKEGGVVQSRNTMNLSPEGKRFASERPVGNGQSDIWIRDLEHGIDTRLTFDASTKHLPVWSPDGSRVAFSRRAGGISSLRVRAANGTGQDEEITLESKNPKIPQDWSRDGRFLIYEEQDPKTNNDLWALPMNNGKPAGKPMPLVGTPFNDSQGQLSPDGRWLAYSSTESGTFQVYVQPFAPSSDKPVAGKWQISTAGGSMPRWRGDGKELFYFGLDRKLMSVDIRANGQAFEHGVPQVRFEARASIAPNNGTDFAYAVSSDGKRFLLPIPAGATAEAPPLTVVVNWLAGVKK